MKVVSFGPTTVLGGPMACSKEAMPAPVPFEDTASLPPFDGDEPLHAWDEEEGKGYVILPHCGTKYEMKDRYLYDLALDAIANGESIPALVDSDYSDDSLDGFIVDSDSDFEGDGCEIPQTPPFDIPSPPGSAENIMWDIGEGTHVGDGDVERFLDQLKKWCLTDAALRATESGAVIAAKAVLNMLAQGSIGDVDLSKEPFDSLDRGQAILSYEHYKGALDTQERLISRNEARMACLRYSAISHGVDKDGTHVVWTNRVAQIAILQEHLDKLYSEYLVIRKKRELMRNKALEGAVVPLSVMRRMAKPSGRGHGLDKVTVVNPVDGPLKVVAMHTAGLDESSPLLGDAADYMEETEDPRAAKAAPGAAKRPTTGELRPVYQAFNIN